MAPSRLVRDLLTGLVVLVLLPCIFAQQSSQGSSTGSGNTSNKSTGNTPTPPPVRNQQDSTNPRQQIQRPVYIYGKVVQEDGSPLPIGTVIEMSCNGRTRREASVAPDGFFSFQVGDINRVSDVLPDASDETMRGPNLFGRPNQPPGMFPGSDINPAMRLVGCELRAAAAGYRSSTVILGADSAAGQLDAGTILLQSIAKVPGTLTSATNLAAPKAARKALERAQKAVQKNRLDDAEKELKTAVEIYPKYAAAWVGLGRVYERTQRRQEARTAFSNAISADDMFVSPYIELARLAAIEKDWRQVADITDHALSLDPLDFPEGFFLNALAQFQLNQRDAAERSARKALRLDTQHRIVQVHLLLANILAQKQDFEGAIEQLRTCLTLAPKAPFADSARAQLEQLERASRAAAGKRPENQ